MYTHIYIYICIHIRLDKDMQAYHAGAPNSGSLKVPMKLKMNTQQGPGLRIRGGGGYC